MKHSYGLVIMLVVCMSHLFAAKSEARLGDLHKQISTDLIFVRNQYPGSQQTVFALLDRVGKMYSLSKQIQVKRVAYKKNFKEQQLAASSLQKEVDQLKTRLLQAKNHIDTLNKQISVKKQEVASLARQKDMLNEKNSVLEAHNKIRQESRIAREIAKEVLKNETHMASRLNGAADASGAFPHKA